MAIAELVTTQIYEAYPELLEKYGEQGKRKCKEDNVHHMRQLDAAFRLANDQPFVDYALWLNGILVRHGMLLAHLIDNFERISGVLAARPLPDAAETNAYRRMLAKGIEALKNVSMPEND